MKRNNDGTVTISDKEFVDLMARFTAQNDALSSLGETGVLIMLLVGHIVAEVSNELFNNEEVVENVEKKKKQKKVSEKIRRDVIKKIDDFINGFFEMRDKPIQVFNTRNTAGDEMYTIYSDNDVIIDYCPNYEYIEIFGLNDKEFEHLIHNSDKVCVD